MNSDHLETIAKAASSGGKRLSDMDKAQGGFHSNDQNPGKARGAQSQFDRALRMAEIDDIESAVRIKQAESNMFQMRADEARQEAGGLRRIISVKCEQIDEDYECKCAKLRLDESEERRQKWFDELQALESSHHEFQKMKSRMESDVKELLLKMELAKRQFA